jgi:YidC/Oxa1 family membrane protein insertase
MPIPANVIENAFSPLISLFEAIMVFIHEHTGLSWGFAIVGLTVVVRTVMVPLTISQFRSMSKLQQLAPQMKELQERYKDDKQRQQQELMKFYQENKVNPFASCLPLLLQFPVFISLFYMLRTDLKKRICGQALREHHIVTAKAIEKTSCNQVAPGSAKFLFIPDITHQATGVVLIVLLLLYVVSQLGSTLMMTATADANQRRMMLALPLIFVLFIFRFPAGLLVYWITTNMWTLGQQYFVRRTMGPPPTRAAGAGAGAGASKSNGSGKPVEGARSDPQPALAGVGAGGRPGSAPPPPPRKKKKRSGRRR